MKPGCCCFLLVLFLGPSKATAASCENGGTAVAGGCVCPPGFNGTSCELRDPSKACQNGGTAVGTKCYCPPGFKGALCQLEDPAGACKNGAEAFGTACVCPPGYQGPTCQDEELPSSCLNGGTLSGSGCRCPPTFWGPRCECKYPDGLSVPTTTTAWRQNVTAGKNDTVEVSQHPPNGTHLTTTPRPISQPNSTAEVSQHPPNGTHLTTTPRPISQPNSTAEVSQHPPNGTHLTTTPRPISQPNSTAEVSQHPPNGTHLTTTPRPISQPNHTVEVSQHPLNGTHLTTTPRPISQPNHTVEVSQHPLNGTHLTTTPRPISQPNHTVEVPHDPPNSTHLTMTPRPISKPNATANASQATPVGTVTGNASISVASTPAPNTTKVPVSLGSTTSHPLSSFCHYFLPWHLNGSSPKLVVCRNGGVANLSECLCPPGFSGPSCETVDDADRCHNGSTAVGNRCICPPGLSGPRCDAYDRATACQNGATAVGTECYCPSGYYGPRCEVYNASATETPATHPDAGRPKSAPEDPGDATKSTASTRRSTTTSEATARSTTTAKSTETTTTTTTTTTTAPTTADPCQNGGSWTGTGCLCSHNIDGSHCQFAASTINITAELGPSATLMARVTNRLFSEALRNSSSAAYRSFAEEFGRTMDRIYQNVSGYHGIRILNLTNGSVVVTYEVLLHPPSGTNPDTGLDRESRELLETLKSAARPQNCSLGARELCFNASSSEVTLAEEPKLNATELCRKYTPANFSRFYYPYRTRYSLLCVTNCTLNVPGTIDCNGGLCRVTLEGPRCFCPDVPWYLTAGDRCQTHISKLGLGLGVGLGLGLTILVLLILCLILTTCLAQGKTKSRSHSTGIYHVNGRG